MPDPQLTCIEDHWQHFARVDIPVDFSPGQRLAMRCAFMAGAVSAVHLFASCVTHSDYEAAVERITSEIEAWNATWKAGRAVRHCRICGAVAGECPPPGCG